MTQKNAKIHSAILIPMEKSRTMMKMMRKRRVKNRSHLKNKESCRLKRTKSMAMRKKTQNHQKSSRRKRDYR